MGKFLIMAEKRNAAEDIAKALQIKNVGKTDTGFIQGTLDGDACVICWSNGHCLTLLEPEQIDPKYKKWKEEDLPIDFNDSTLNAIKDKEKLLSAIKKEIKAATTIINAGDAGREGELIQRWIIDQTLPAGQQRIYRMWSQSLTSAAIAKAFDNLLGVNESQNRKLDSLYDSGRARVIMDKFLGYNYSRLLTLTQTDGVTINYGRCKTPLTHAIIERDREIENFVPEEYSYIRIDIQKDNITCKATLVDPDKKRITYTNKNDAAQVFDNIGSTVLARKVVKNDKFATPPFLFDILSLQKKMAQKYNYDADRTLALCQELYDKHHLISYPRTDSQFLTTDLKPEMKESLLALRFGRLEKFVEVAEKSFIPDKYFNDKKVADHHALIPVVPDANLEEKYNNLSGEAKNVYDAIATSFIALWLPNYEYESIEALLEDNENTFLLKGKREKRLGWKELYIDDQDDNENEDDDTDKNDNQEVIKLIEGERIDIQNKELKNDKTKPKSRFTIASLLDFMKVHHIGTGATRDTLIKELTEKRGFNSDSSVRKEGKYFISTQFGRDIDSAVPDDLKSIEYLKGLEQEIENIADGKSSMKDFIQSIKSDFETKKQYMLTHRQAVLTNDKKPAQKESKFNCKICGAPLLDQKWGYSCSKWSKDGNGCNFSISKDYFGTKITDASINQLLSSGKTSKKLKLKKKAGGTYEAYLTLVEDNGKWKLKPSFD